MKQRGFTLIEMIITIIILAIIFLGIAGFVEFGTKGYVQSVDRQRLQNQARFAIEKMSREIRYAVPNSFKTVSDDLNKCLIFYPIQYSGFYKFVESTKHVEFVVSNEDYSHPHTFSTDTRLVINPSRIEDLDESGPQAVGLGSTTTSTLGHYFSVAMNLTSQSSAKRHFIYQDKTVTYCVERTSSSDETGRVVRYYGDIEPNTAITDINHNIGVIVATGLAFSDSDFIYQQTALQRGGLVHLDLLFKNGDEQSQYKHDVQVSNVP
ncbi:prepilin-type N-terminal cleavage/methylation domain-containing protein [Vibrio neonatus]|uniref:prepilin-type N-terminal cleavage/methylation domain-containing protein n=1 Tax=Vibrio neonatus TaxID=278860 RepID=UPI0021C3283B|nr:prepilin-type N-terminal cleavage/methylation domain-containing protein [Vibrio neonatus]